MLVQLEGVGLHLIRRSRIALLENGNRDGVSREIGVEVRVGELGVVVMGAGKAGKGRGRAGRMKWGKERQRIIHFPHYREKRTYRHTCHP